MRDELHGWMFAAARAAAGMTTFEAAGDADIAELTLRKIEGQDVIKTRDDPKNKRAGGIDADLVDRLRKTYEAQGFQMRTACGGWPAAVVYTRP